ncbi:MAG TPA: cupin domain-containing protein [Aciduliprofundum sp.]|nr:cupin domain-containing protein [Aciduliprofundum sp.]
MVRAFDVRRASWSPHPMNPKVKVAEILKTRNVRLVLVEVPEGASVDEHIHERERDTVYVLEGEVEFWVEGLGEMVLKEGMALSIEPGKRHALRRAFRKSVLLDLFSRE